MQLSAQGKDSRLRDVKLCFHFIVTQYLPTSLCRVAVSVIMTNTSSLNAAIFLLKVWKK